MHSKTVLLLSSLQSLASIYNGLFSALFISISGKEWMTGKRLFDYIRKQTLPDGTTGRVAFDEMGDRIYAEYQVVNVQSSSKEKRVVVGRDFGGGRFCCDFVHL